MGFKDNASIERPCRVDENIKTHIFCFTGKHLNFYFKSKFPTILNCFVLSFSEKFAGNADSSFVGLTGPDYNSSGFVAVFTTIKTYLEGFGVAKSKEPGSLARFFLMCQEHFWIYKLSPDYLRIIS